ncbi:Uma2 family endonuclease [Herbihabitans rhizosphaerae]|uniref:Uma2 family endonuclease n=1 Tax=Herbihabitans rhizosphaerae TaxID=1872711 RepID=A0A4Q7L4C2_9PSEU|nr:Uma2 family endonuclease [Herbihabitans rhizosphaerae]RZS43341.1 Uma2 family endonuclease [Herbihabitans rhizosphaerae]
MTTAAPWPDHLLSLDEFLALPEDNSRIYELHEGVLIVSPRPAKPHQRVINKLVPILNEQLPPEWEAFGELDLIVQAGEPPIVRVPDVVVAPADDARNVPAAEALIAVEIISPGSYRTDTKIKPMEYSEAGIEHYWVIDLKQPVSLTAYRLDGPVYRVADAVTGKFVTGDPFPIAVDLEELAARRVEGGKPE